jgi:hypothetical protein
MVLGRESSAKNASHPSLAGKQAGFTLNRPLILGTPRPRSQEETMTKLGIAVALAFAVGAAPSIRADEMKHPPQSSSKELERVKQLVGTWKGPSDMDGKKGETKVIYHLTSGGSAVVETLDPGTPHEMITVFHDEGGKLAMTHYCAMGNQPHMKLVAADDKSLSLELAKGGSIDPAKDAHMHALTMTFDGNDRLTEKWTSLAQGKESSHAVFTLARASDTAPAK